jgi:hypothetical protein
MLHTSAAVTEPQFTTHGALKQALTERRELLEFLHTVLATELGIVEPKILPLSAKRALAAALHSGEGGGLPVFRATLDHFLLHEKGRVALTAAAGAALRLTGEARFLLEVEKRALATPLEELEEKLVEFDRLRARAEQDHRDFQHLLKAEAHQSLAQFLALQRMMKVTQRRLETFFGTWLAK